MLPEPDPDAVEAERERWGAMLDKLPDVTVTIQGHMCPGDATCTAPACRDRIYGEGGLN